MEAHADTITAGEEEAPAHEGPVSCPFCAQLNEAGRHCRHVRWTFDQGGPIEFACFAIETSPYTQARGHSAREITESWLQENGEWIVERVLHHFEAKDGFVFGQIADLDLLARDVWREFHPESERPRLERVDPV